jgi:hypothetical protein
MSCNILAIAAMGLLGYKLDEGTFEVRCPMNGRAQIHMDFKYPGAPVAIYYESTNLIEFIGAGWRFGEEAALENIERDLKVYGLRGLGFVFPRAYLGYYSTCDSSRMIAIIEDESIYIFEMDRLGSFTLKKKIDGFDLSARIKGNRFQIVNGKKIINVKLDSRVACPETSTEKTTL